MCRRQFALKPCMNYQCSHNLFWKELGLNPKNFKTTNRALEIGNCCCLINKPWSAEDIGAAWGLSIGSIMQSERIAWEKIYKKSGWEQSDQAVSSLLN